MAAPSMFRGLRVRLGTGQQWSAAAFGRVRATRVHDDVQTVPNWHPIVHVAVRTRCLIIASHDPFHATAAHCVCVGVCGQMPVIVRALLAASTAEPVCVKLAEAPARPGLTTSRGEPSKQTHPPARFTKLDGEGDGAGEAQVAQD